MTRGRFPAGLHLPGWSTNVRCEQVNRSHGGVGKKCVRVHHDILVARRQRLTGSRLAGPWQGSFHVRDIASKQWLSAQPDQPALVFATHDMDFKRLRQSRAPGKTVAPGPTPTNPVKITQGGTLNQKEIAFCHKEREPKGSADPLMAMIPIQSCAD